MESDIKWNSGRYKLLTTILILTYLIVCFKCFICYFNTVFEFESIGFEISVKEDLKEVCITPFLLVFGFLGSLGSMVRVIYDFIGNTCYTKNFDLKIWWPWYVFLPLLGFILGSVLVVFFDHSLFGDDSNDLSKFPFILSFITGFAITDAISFLREVSKRLFGVQDNKRKDKNGQEED